MVTIYPFHSHWLSFLRSAPPLQDMEPFARMYTRLIQGGLSTVISELPALWYPSVATIM